MGASSLRRVAGLAGVEQRPRLDLQRDCWRRLRHWRRSVRSTGAGGRLDGVRRHDQRGRPCQRPEPNGPGDAGTKRHLATDACGTPLGLRLTGANQHGGRRLASHRCHAAVRQAIIGRLFGGLVPPCDVHRCHKRVRLPSDPKVLGSMLANRRAWPSAVRRQGKGSPRALRGLGVSRNASTGRLRRVQPDWSPPAMPGLLRHHKVARSHACRHLRRSMRRNRTAWSVERSALTS